jgi:hypothetical protein
LDKNGGVGGNRGFFKIINCNFLKNKLQNENLKKLILKYKIDK